MPAPLRTLCGLAGFAASLGFGTPAFAAPAEYLCDGGTVLSGDFSPRAAQVRFEGTKWTLLRARESREARYLNARAGVSMTLSRNIATLNRKDQPPLACKLVVRALRNETLEGVQAAPAR